MGRACSKVAPQEISSPSSLQYVNATAAAASVPVTPQVLQDLIARLAPETGPLKFLTNRLQLKIQEIQVGKAYAEIRPPHEQVFDDPPQLTNTFNFYVSIYELRIKELVHTPSVRAGLESGSLLPLAQQLSTTSHVGRGGRRTNSGAASATSSASPSASSADYVALVSWDNNSEFIRTTFERLDDTGSLRFPGHWNFLWRFEGQTLSEMRDRYLLIALFRLEHLRNASLVGYATIDILSITVGPIHHDFAFNRWGMIGESLNKARVQFECRTTQICNLSCIPVEVRVSIEGGHIQTPENSAIEPNSCGTPPPQTQSNHRQPGSGGSTPSSPDTPQTANQNLNVPPDQGLRAQVNEGLDLIPPKAKSVSNLGARLGGGGGGGSSSSSVVAVSTNPLALDPSNNVPGNSKLLQKKVSVIAEVDELDCPTTKHQGDDEKCLVKAEWKVDFAVSGIANAVPSASTWTSVTSEPYWLAIDSTAPPPQDRELYVVPVGTDGPGNAGGGSGGGGGGGGRQQTADWSVSNPESGRSSFRQKPLNGSRTAIAGSYSNLPESSTPLSPQRNQNGAFKLDLSSNPHILRQRFENDYQITYRVLASTCQKSSVISFAKSALAKNSCLQPFYLRTTSEGIRQYYLMIRLWHKPLGVGSAKLYAEALVPFFKLFDADVVTCRSFFDAKFCETLWSDGRKVGQISAVLVFQDIPVLRQMFAGISTENGYHRLISPSMLPIDSQLHVIPEVALLSQLTLELEKHWLRTNVMHAEKVRETTTTSSSADAAAVTPPFNISDINEKLMDLLSKSSISPAGAQITEDTSTPIFQYPSISCLMEGQKILLELGNHILVSQDFLPWHLRGVLGNILILILKRGELEIGNVLPQVPPQFLDRRKEMLNLYNMTKASSTDDLPASPQQVVTTTSTLEPVSTAAGGSAAPPLTASDKRDLANYNSRMAITLSYANFLMKLLVCANEKIQSGAMFESQRKQIASYYAVLYNRIPALRSKILQTVLTDEERDLYVPEWRGVEFGLDKASLLQRDDWSARPWPGLYELQLILDWSPFYQALTDYYGSSGSSSGGVDCQSSSSCCCSWLDPDDRIEQIFSDQPNALNWLRPRSFTFYLFLNSLIRLTWSQLDFNQQKKLAAASGTADSDSQPQNASRGAGSGLRHNLAPTRIFFQRNPVAPATAVTSKPDHELTQSVSGAKGSVTRAALGNLRWDLIPGYASLLKAFLLELCDKPVSKFSDALLNCSATLLVNDRLLAVFMRIVLTRTSVFSRDQVFSAFNYLDFWFEVFTLKGLALPLTMDYRLLSKAIEAVLSSDLALQTAKTLWFLYKRMDLFVTQKLMLKIIADLILYKNSQKLLLHWSWLVRKCFTHLLLYRVCENARKIVARSSTGEPPQLGVEERLILYSYLLISEITKALGIASVFPEKFSTVSIRRLLGQPLPHHQQHASATLIWNLPSVLNTVAPNTPTKIPNNTSLSAGSPQDTPLIDDSYRKSLNSPTKDPGRSWMIRRPTAFKFRKRKSVKDEDDDEVLQDPTGDDDVPVFEYEPPEPYLPAIAEPTAQMKPYVQHIVVEFASEVEQYKLWVISGKAEVPPMHIPASPLDTNVDVPLEVD